MISFRDSYRYQPQPEPWGWEAKLCACFFFAVCLILLYTEAFGETVTFQTKDPSTKCPFKADATMSQSIWNSGGWPLWKKTCWRKDKK